MTVRTTSRGYPHLGRTDDGAEANINAELGDDQQGQLREVLTDYESSIQR